MGYGEVTGNGSVHWKIDHERGPGKIKDKKDKNRPKKNDPANVHLGDVVYGRDDVAATMFVVTLRFGSAAAAANALQPAFDAAQKALGASQSGRYEVTVEVPCGQRPNPDGEPADVSVKWNGTPETEVAPPTQAQVP